MKFAGLLSLLFYTYCLVYFILCKTLYIFTINPLCYNKLYIIYIKLIEDRSIKMGCS